MPDMCLRSLSIGGNPLKCQGWLTLLTLISGASILKGGGLTDFWEELCLKPPPPISANKPKQNMFLMITTIFSLQIYLFGFWLFIELK